MKFKQLGEDIVDDILADFPQFRQERTTPPQPKFKPQPSKARDPVKVQGVEHDSFSTWLRSVEQVRQACQDKLGSPKLSLRNCIKLYTEHNMKIDDFVVINFPTNSVYPFREYDREIENGWSGKMTSEEYTELARDIKTNGIKNPGILEISNFKDGSYDVMLGEGNHRLKAAIDLNIDAYPLSFYYRFG